MNGIYEGPLYPRVQPTGPGRCTLHWGPEDRTLNAKHEHLPQLGGGSRPEWYAGMTVGDDGSFQLYCSKTGPVIQGFLSEEGIQPPSDIPPHLAPNDHGPIEDAYRTPEEKCADLVARVERLERLVESMPISPLDAG